MYWNGLDIDFNFSKKTPTKKLLTAQTRSNLKNLPGFDKLVSSEVLIQSLYFW